MKKDLELGLKENWQQFSLLVVVNAFVGGMIGLERSILPQLAESEFGVASKTAVLSFIIAFGVVYNSARIQLSERANELATLRVLGFGRAEVSNVLLIETGTIVALAQPIGWLIATGLGITITESLATDMFRVPFIIEPDTFAISSLVVVAAAVVSALIVRRRVDRLDLVRVLKTRE